jgi:hypothetical protein
VTYKTSFGLDDWIYCTLYNDTIQDYRQYSAIASLHTLQFTVTHVLAFTVFTSRILATDLSQSISLQITHEVFFSQPNFFLAIIVDSVQFFCSQAGVSKLDPSLPTPLHLFYYFSHYAVPSSASFYNTSVRTTQKTQPLLLIKCLLVRYLAMDVLLLHAYA